MKRPVRTAKSSSILAGVASFGFLVMGISKSGAEHAVYISAAMIIWVLSWVLDELSKWGRM